MIFIFLIQILVGFDDAPQTYGIASGESEDAISFNICALNICVSARVYGAACGTVIVHCSKCILGGSGRGRGARTQMLLGASKLVHVRAVCVQLMWNFWNI